MGGATAPVEGSGSLPAWMARVEKPGAFFLGIENQFTTAATTLRAGSGKEDTEKIKIAFHSRGAGFGEVVVMLNVRRTIDKLDFLFSVPSVPPW